MYYTFLGNNSYHYTCSERTDKIQNVGIRNEKKDVQFCENKFSSEVIKPIILFGWNLSEGNDKYSPWMSAVYQITETNSLQKPLCWGTQ